MGCLIMYIKWLFFILIFAINQTLAFDDDRTLSFPDFNRENFLDITGYQYRKQLDDEWQASDNGFRLAGGSLGQDVLFSILDFKFRTHLNYFTEFRLTSQQQAFYTVKPEYHQVEIGIHPKKWLYFSFLGSPTYDKRRSDMGTALEIGSRPQNYLRFVYLRHDVFFNDKNSLDDGFYQQIPIERQLEVVTQFNDAIKVKLYLIEDDYFSEILATDLLGNQGEFNHKGDSGKLEVDYHFGHEKLIGFKITGFNFKKALLTRSSQRRQDFKYLSATSFYIFPGAKSYGQSEVTLGLRYDQLTYDTQNLLDNNASVERYFDTSQMYAIVLVPHRAWLNFEYALHLGYANLKSDFINQADRGTKDEGVETKFRYSMELISDDKNRRLMFSSNWNLDDLQGQFWDGGHISFQGRF